MSALAAFAPCAVLLSDMPGIAAWPVAVAAFCVGFWLARREALQPPCAIVIDSAGAATVDGAPVDEFDVDWRGPLAFLSWRDREGRAHRRSLWPDTLAPALRRELRLAASRDDAGRRPGPMAP
ncbi:MAG: hypothetical protein ACOY82_09610 [Pseudomonadota bacterium]